MLNNDQKKLLYKIATEDKSSLRGRDVGMLTGGLLGGSAIVGVNKFLSGSYNPVKWRTGAARNMNALQKFMGVPKQHRKLLLSSYKFGKKHPILSTVSSVSNIATPMYLGYSIGKGLEEKKND